MIGLQLYSLKEMAEKDFLGTLEKVGKVGFDGVEFAGYFGTPSKDLKEALDHYGLKAAGSHIGIEDLEKNLNKVIEYSLEIENPSVICPGLPEDYRNSAEAYKRTAEFFNRVGERCKQNGVLFGYHNHDFEFQTFEGKTGLQHLIDETEDDHVFFELDTYWAEVCGIPSVELIHQLKDRCKWLHLKDMNNWNEKRNVEVGNGVLDWEEIVSKGKSQSVDWYTIEQEAFDIDQMESIEISLRYLRGIL
ncbi:sugar phosphate isomerase/epimerase family protein [Halobacillus litoralis]|uniref:sugar phosphate isomerase/epimerase family protein n=1 Tax=Halobacillus litoralis TaxID=45668 RepID=UPI00249395EA|nr:sugar phosphate isomerase/epimerase [Halobacillus litoralis]